MATLGRWWIVVVVVVTVVFAARGVAGQAKEQPPLDKLPQQRTVELGGGVKMELVLIRPGSFKMGSEKGDNDEKPVHKVTITKPFYMGKYEVTQEQWQAVMGSNPSSFKGPKNPVDLVTWEDCQTFIRKLNEKVPGLNAALPTEAQWEYACRAGSSTEYCYGDDAGGLGEYAWFEGNSGQTTHPVGEKKPNAWGLYDMHGNVWEWCQDRYGKEYYASSPASDPTGLSSGAFHVLRGGSWGYLGPTRCRAAARYGPFPLYRYDSKGLRVVSPVPGSR